MTDDAKLGFVDTVKTFPRSFWMGCGVEMWERLAYYGVRSVVPLYIAQADDPGGSAAAGRSSTSDGASDRDQGQQ